jgi:CheY-like chemotaxis protein
VNRRVVHEQITTFRMRNGSYASGAEAMEALRKAVADGDPYHLAIVDFQMPLMDGEEFARALKADPQLRDTGVVLLTSVGEAWEASRLRRAGIFASLTKPVRQGQLLDTLAAAWAARHEGRHGMAAADRRIIAQPTPVPVFDGYSPRVLVAEDNMVNQRIASRLLEKLGCKVDVVANGKEAVEMIAGIDYDMVLMDVMMPEMDGFKATGEVRREDRPHHRVPIVAMTANAMQGDRERCLEAGMNDYVSKPVHSADLQRILQHWVKVKRA